MSWASSHTYGPSQLSKRWFQVDVACAYTSARVNRGSGEYPTKSIGIICLGGSGGLLIGKLRGEGEPAYPPALIDSLSLLPYPRPFPLVAAPSLVAEVAEMAFSPQSPRREKIYRTLGGKPCFCNFCNAHTRQTPFHETRLLFVGVSRQPLSRSFLASPFWVSKYRIPFSSAQLV